MSTSTNALLRNILVVVVALALLGLIAFALPVWVPAIPARFWQLLALCLAGLAILWWFTAGSRRYATAGRSRQRIGDLGPGNPDDEREPLANMQATIQAAKRTIARSPEIGGRNSLYRVPWMLFLGDDEANLDALLRGASTVSPFPAPPPLPEDPWSWWFFKSMIAIETTPNLVCDTSDRLHRGLWYQALRQLASERDMLPLNGIVVTVGAKTLLGNPDALKTTSMRLRRLVDEAMEHLQVNVPVYFVVTGLERLVGYEGVRKVLPASVFNQALGFRVPDKETVTADSSTKLDAILAPIHARLHALRMSALAAQADAAGRQAIFEFFQSIMRMHNGLHSFVMLLLEDNPFQRTPRWRGLYFAAAQAPEYPQGAFVADLFTRLLPADQPLATTSLKGSSGRLAVAGVGVLALLAFSAYLSYSLVQARHDDARLMAQTRAACLGSRGGGASGRIHWVASCGRTIEKLEASADNSFLGFGIRRSDRDISHLKQEVVTDFSNLILAPYDQMLDADIARGDVSIQHVLAVAQRLRILDHCRGHGATCLKSEVPFNVVFDPQSRLFAPFRSADNDTRIDRDNAEALLTTYIGYLRWQNGDVLDDEQSRLRDELARMLTRYTLQPGDVQKWADARMTQVRLTDFWLPSDKVVGVDESTLPTVSAAYTKPAWQGIVNPMLTTLTQNLPEKKTLFDGFRERYFNAYFDAWAGFQAHFPEGADLWRGHDDDLIVRAAGDDNPYRFFFDSAQTHLLDLPLHLTTAERWSMARTRMQRSWWRAWRPLGHFIGISVSGWFAGHSKVEPPQWLLAMQDTRTQVLGHQRAQFADAYLRLTSDPSGQSVYPIMADLYAAKGMPTRAPASTYASLLQSVSKPADRFSTLFKGDDLQAWSIVQGPAHLLLHLTMQRAAKVVQQHWTDSVVKPLAKLPAHDQVIALYGDHGKLNAFVADWLQPFVSLSEHVPVKIDGIGLPLTPAFEAAVSAQNQLQPVLGVQQPFLAATFTFSGPTQMGRATEGPAGTVLMVDCKQRQFQATSNAPSLMQAQAQVFWSPDACLQASLQIDIAPPEAADNVSALVDAAAAPGTATAGKTSAAPSATPAPAPVATPPPAPLSLTRIYSDAEGFEELIKDFAAGYHTFTLADFRASYSPMQWEALLPRLREVRFASARVLLRAEPTDQMRQYMAARHAPAAIPTTIVN